MDRCQRDFAGVPVPHILRRFQQAHLRKAFADSLASAALNGSVSPIPAIFSLKSQCGWRDGGADDGDVIGTDGDEASFDLRQILARYEGQEAAEGASGALDDASDV